MRGLSLEDKIVHNEEFGKYIEWINNKINPFKDILSLKHVSYIIPVDDTYFYFDYPYNIAVENFNDELSKNIELNNINNNIFSLFHDFQKNTFDDVKRKKYGYIYYNYDFNSDKNLYLIYDVRSNLTGILNNRIVEKYLPIIDSAVFLNQTYKSEVILATPENVKGIKLLTVCKRLTSQINNEIKAYTLSCSFVLNINLSENELTEKVTKLYSTLIYFVEKYFDSPILKQIFIEQRKSNILGYQHTIDNLRIDIEANFINYLLNNEDISDSEKILLLKKKYIYFQARLNLLRLTHYAMFQVEYLKSDEQDLNNSRMYPLANKTITEIISYLITHTNIYENVESLFDNFIDKALDFIPKQGDNFDMELYDLQLVLFNIWKNACAVTAGLNQKNVWIKTYSLNNKLCVCVKNYGEMDRDIRKYLNNFIDVYPQKFRSVNKPRKGLEIVKEICNRKERNWKINVTLEKDNNNDIQTVVSVLF